MRITPAARALTLCLIFTAAIGLSQTAKGPLFFEGFEGTLSRQWHFGINGDKDPLRLKGDAQAIADAGLVRIVTAPVRAGGRAVRFEIPRRLGSFRSEIALSGVPLFSDYWYGFSIFIPGDWIDDPQDGDIVAQWHGSAGEDKKLFKVEGDGKGRPPVALSLHGDEWQVAVNSSAAVVKDAKDWAGYQSKRDQFHLGKFRKGVWTDWVFHMRWSYKADGLLEVWQNGKQVLQHAGPNCYNDPNGPYFKIGIYHPAWKDFEGEKFNRQKVIIPRKVIFHDEVRVISGGTYDDVAPHPAR
jgi:hypothetical protein